jgi:hypothetical protein
MNEDIVIEILEAFKELQIIREVDGLYEIKHDSLAAKVNIKRTTEDKKRIEATQLIYDVEKSGGLLDEKQLNRLEPYLNKLGFKNGDKERMEKYLIFCINKISAEKLEKQMQIAKEQKLRSIAEENEKEANRQRAIAEEQRRIAQENEKEANIQKVKAENEREKADQEKRKAIAAEKKALKRKTLARQFAFVCIALALFAIYSYFMERKQKLILLTNNAKSLIAEGKYFDSAYMVIKQIESTRDWVPGVMTSNELERDLGDLKNTILFHATASSIKATPQYILLANPDEVILKGVNNHPLSDSTTYFFRKDNLRDRGFSDFSPQFWSVQPVDSSKKRINLYSIGRTNIVQTDSVNTINGVTAGACDEKGNLYYYSDRAIYCYNLTSKSNTLIYQTRIKIDSTRSFIRLGLFFLRDKNRPSKYLMLNSTTDPRDYIINIQSKQEYTITKGTQWLLDGNNFKNAEILNNQLYRLTVSNLDATPISLTDKKDFVLTREKDVEYYSDSIFKNAELNARAQESAPEPFSPDRKKYYKNSNGLLTVFYRDKNGLEKVAFTKKLNEGKDTIRDLRLLNDVFVYVFSSNGTQKVGFRDYKGKEQLYNIPKDWTYVGFSPDKFLRFESKDKNNKREALLIVNSYMSEDNHLNQWFSIKTKRSMVWLYVLGTATLFLIVYFFFIRKKSLSKNE